MPWLKKILMVFIFFIPLVAQAKNQQVLIGVDGLTCPLCVSMINKALRETEGVLKAKTSMPKKETVVIVPQEFDTEKLIEAIEKTGYRGEIKSIQETDEK